MKDIVQIVGCCAITPAVVAVTMIFLTRRFLPPDLFRRYGAASAFSIAFVTSYVLLPSWAALVPERHWHWLPYLAFFGALLGGSTIAEGIWRVERKLIQLTVTVIAAYLLVPTWEALWPPRPYAISGFAGYLVVTLSLMEPLTTRLPVSRFLALLSMAAFSSTLLVTFAVSVKFGQLGGIAAAALAGVWLSTKLFAPDLDIRGCLLAALTVMCGVAFVAAIEPTPSLFDLLLVPAAPLMLWLCMFKQMNQRRDIPSAILQAAAVLAPIAIVAIRMVMADLRSGE